jgi:hypothetical protein
MATVDNSIKISALGAATPPLNASDLIPVVQGGTTRQVPAYAVQSGRVRSFIVTGLPLTSTGDIATVSLSNILSTGSGTAKYRPTSCFVYDASVSLAGTTAATLAVRTAAAGGGSQLITALTAANLQTLTSATVIFTATVTANAYYTVPTLYIRLTTSGASGTVSMYMQLTELV